MNNGKFAPNLSMVLKNVPLEIAFRRMHEMDFKVFEFWFPQQFDIGRMITLCGEFSMSAAAFDLDITLEDWSRGFLANPAQETGASFLRSLDAGLRLADELECKKLIVLLGNRFHEYTVAQQIDTAVERLIAISTTLISENCILLIEPINQMDNPGYFLNDLRTAIEIVESVNLPQVRLLLDTYHLFKMNLDPAQTVRSLSSYIGHIQIGDAPNRNEPGRGQIDFKDVFQSLADIGYDDYIGLEYVPTDPAAPFDWMQGET